MIDVFLTTNASHPIRIGFALAAISRWVQAVREGKVRLIVTDIGSGVALWEALDRLNIICGRDFEYDEKPAEDSQRLRHIWAAEQAKTTIYAVADDDILIDDRVTVRFEDRKVETWDEHVTRVMGLREDLVMCAPLPYEGGLNVNLDEPALRKLGIVSDDTWVTSSVGGIRFVRKGSVGTWIPPMESIAGGGYDSTLCTELVHRRKLRIGFMPRLRAVHLGYYRSTVWSGEFGLKPILSTPTEGISSGREGTSEVPRADR